jgi:hypothetical protein
MFTRPKSLSVDPTSRPVGSHEQTTHQASGRIQTGERTIPIYFQLCTTNQQPTLLHPHPSFNQVFSALYLISTPHFSILYLHDYSGRHPLFLQPKLDLPDGLVAGVVVVVQYAHTSTTLFIVVTGS